MKIKNLVIAVMTLACCFAVADMSTAEVYELRTYTTKDGRLDRLHARFRDHTIKLFDKHGMKSIGYWVPTDGDQSKNTLIYVLEHKSRDAAKASWKAFLDDPVWQKAYKESTVDGSLLARAPESVYMNEADYSPKFENTNKSADGVYELRIYKTNDDKLPGLDARFRDHTIKLFERHGIESVAYWHPLERPDSDDTLIYIIRHKSRDGAQKSWRGFGSDPDWKKVARESQKDGRFLREKPTSIYLKATDYSVLK